MRQTIDTISGISQLQGFRDATLKGANGIAANQPDTLGVFNSFDFHIAETGPALIEINTNAGGAFLTAMAARAHDPCCLVPLLPGHPEPSDFSARVAHMFNEEWRRSGRAGQPRTVAIVDDAPETQYLYPEFLLARAHLQEMGLDAMIVDASDLRFTHGALRFEGKRIDLVYNRLTDFGLEEGVHGAMREAVETGAAIVTPHPFHHALLADKRNLVHLTDAAFLTSLGVGLAERNVLARIPKTVLVNQDNAAQLWTRRKELFFKPVTGHGSKGVFRGDKLTRSTWSSICEGGYIAQLRVNPSARRVLAGDGETMLKTDIRAFTYGADILLVAARLYQGQVTNMRTAAGGLAPVSIG